MQETPGTPEQLVDVEPAAVEAPTDPAHELPETVDEVSHEQALAIQAAEALQMVRNTPTLNMVLNGAPLRILKDEESGERQMVVGPIFVNVVLPLNDQVAHGLARELTGGIEIAHAMSQTDIEAALQASGGLKRVK